MLIATCFIYLYLKKKTIRNWTIPNFCAQQKNWNHKTQLQYIFLFIITPLHTISRPSTWLTIYIYIYRYISLDPLYTFNFIIKRPSVTFTFESSCLLTSAVIHCCKHAVAEFIKIQQMISSCSLWYILEVSMPSLDILT